MEDEWNLLEDSQRMLDSPADTQTGFDFDLDLGAMRELTWDGHTEVLRVRDQQFPLELVQADTRGSCTNTETRQNDTSHRLERHTAANISPTNETPPFKTPALCLEKCRFKSVIHRTS